MNKEGYDLENCEPITPKQQEYIENIRHVTAKEFSGITKKDAQDFISVNLLDDHLSGNISDMFSIY